MGLFDLFQQIEHLQKLKGSFGFIFELAKRILNLTSVGLADNALERIDVRDDSRRG